MSAEVKALQDKLASFKSALAAVPDDTYLKGIIKATEEQLEKAAPKHEMQTSELQRQLEVLQAQVLHDQELIQSKSDFAAKKAAEVQDACVKIAVGLRQKATKIDDLVKQLALRRSSAPASPDAQDVPMPRPQAFDATAFVAAPLAWLETVRAKEQK